MSLLRRTCSALGSRVATTTTAAQQTYKTSCSATSLCDSNSPSSSSSSLTSSAPTPQPSLTSSSELWESAVTAFHDAFHRYTHNAAHWADMTQAAELAMRRCLTERRAAEALEVYETLCRCGLVGSHLSTAAPATTTFSATAAATKVSSLDQLARHALQLVPHRKCQYAMLSLLMAAETDGSNSKSNINVFAEGVFDTAEMQSGVEVDPRSKRKVGVTRGNRTRGASETQAVPHPALLPHLQNVSAAEKARIRVYQRLRTLHATGQLRQPLGKEYCLVEMQELCGGAGVMPTRASTSVATAESISFAAGSSVASAKQLSSEIEVGPLCALSRCLLEHPFAFTTPSAAWAQRELLWDADMRSDAAWWSTAHSVDALAEKTFSSTRTSTPLRVKQSCALCPADARRLASIDHVVSPYRSLCKSPVTFLATTVPYWDALLVRRVAETLVLPPEAHIIFPAKYHRARRGAGCGNGSGEAVGRRSNTGSFSVDLESGRGGTAAAATAAVRAATAWTDAGTHQLFGCPDAAPSSSSRSDHDCSPQSAPFFVTASSSPLARVEGILKRRVHHDVVVPDTAYVLHRFHQLRQLARHREVILTHAVFLELVDVAARTNNALRFHARRVLREVMLATTTSVTAAAARAAERAMARKEYGSRGMSNHYTHKNNSSSRSSSTSSMPSSMTRKHQRATCGFTLLGLQDELALLENCPERFFLQEQDECSSVYGNVDDALRNSTSCRATSSISVVLVAKQVERVIAAHDRGEDFANETSNAAGSSIVAGSMELDVDSLVNHLLEGNLGEPTPSTARLAATERVEPLFKNRSRGHWARLPALVATTSDNTRAAAFQVGLSMYPPAGVAP